MSSILGKLFGNCHDVKLFSAPVSPSSTKETTDKCGYVRSRLLARSVIAWSNDGTRPSGDPPLPDYSWVRGSKVFVFGPDRKIWELDKSLATAGDVLGRSYMQRFYEGAVLHDRRRRGIKGQDSTQGTETAWVNGREVSILRLRRGHAFALHIFSQDHDEVMALSYVSIFIFDSSVTIRVDE